MKLIQYSLKTGMALLTAAVLFTSCNKDLPQATPIVPPPPTGSTIAQLLDGPNYSFLKAAVTRAGLMAPLGVATNLFTVFAPTNDAFIASGIPSIDVINTLPVATLNSIISYHVIGGRRLAATDISEKYPNMYLQSLLMLQAPSAALPPGYRMPLGISRRGTNAWANNIPVTQANIAAANGIIHNVARVINPPSQVLAQIVSGDASYSYLLAALARADAGPPPGAPRLIPLLSNAAANFTVFAPTNEAFEALYTALGLGAAGPITPASVNLLPSATVWGIVAFHVQGVRAFSPNLGMGTSNRPSVMGVDQQFNITASAAQVRGPGNVVPTPGGPVNFFANITAVDINAINGVIHRVDAVLVPAQ